MEDNQASISGAGSASPNAVRAQLERMLSSELFANAGTLSRFLRFIVDETLNGQGEHIKEYRIGVEVFGRGDGFDPKEDTIVRVQARNLRAKLASYYESVGARDPVVIELPKGGYAPVFRSAEPVRKEPAKRLRVELYVGLVLVVALAAGAYWISRRPAHGNQPPSLLVWPFEDQGSDTSKPYLANGISSDLVSVLGTTGSLRVVHVPRISPGNTAGALGFAKRFQVQFVLDGTARAKSGKVSLVLRLLRTADGSQIWQQEFVKPGTEMSAVLEESAKTVLSELRLEWPKDRPLITSRVADLETYDLYQQAVHSREPDAAATLLEQVVARDPNYAPAYARLALLYPNDGTQESLAKAKAAAARALQFDDKLSDAHVSRAVLLDHYDLDWNAAEREYNRALELDAGSSDACYFYSVLLTRMGRFDDALSQIRKGEEFAPLNTALRGEEAWTLGMQRHYDQSLELLRNELASHPRDYNLNLFLGDIYLHKGEFERALLAFEAIESGAQRQPLVIGLEGYAHAVLGHTAEARKFLKRLENLSGGKSVPPTSFAYIYIGLGDRNAAFQWLEKALLNDRFMLSGLKVWPVYDSLHNDPRYFALLAKLGLN